MDAMVEDQLSLDVYDNVAVLCTKRHIFRAIKPYR